MTSAQLREEISIELECLSATVQEIDALYRDVADREPTVREKTAAGAFLAQFYGGIENILKRIHRYYDLPLPVGDTWHVDLFLRYCVPGFETLPVLFDEMLASRLAPFRKFRHVVMHGYGFQLDWDRMTEGLASVHMVFASVSNALDTYLSSLGEDS